MKVGDTVMCTAKSVSQEKSEITVEIWGINIETRILLKDLFDQSDTERCVFYAGAVARHDPSYSIVRVGRTFTAKVVGQSPLRLSRSERIKDLWQELEKKAASNGYVTTLVLGQNRDSYFLCIEGNIFFHCKRSPFDKYLRSLLPTDPLWHKYAPMEGDTLIGQIVSASAVKPDVRLDLVDPLERLEAEDATCPSTLLGSFHSISRSTKRGVVRTPEDKIPLPKWFRINHSGEFDSRRKATRVVIVENDVGFGRHLAQMLNEIGYRAEFESRAERVLHIAADAGGELFFIVDAVMEPKDGLSLIAELTRQYRRNAKCILMSALRLDEALQTQGRIPLGEALRRQGIRCPFWSKCQLDLEAALQNLDEILLNYKDHISEPHRDQSALLPAPPSGQGETLAVSEDYLDDLALILEQAKNDTGAQWGTIFEMDGSEWQVRVLAGDEFLKQKADQTGAQTYLPNSPVRDISYLDCPVLIEGEVGQAIPRFRNLLRFFGEGELDDPVEIAAFQSVAALRLDIETSKRYSLFLFHAEANRFERQHTLPILEQAARKAELVILRRLHTLRRQVDQPFYLEGLARTGLRHDARGLITDIQMTAALSRRALQAGDIHTVKKGLAEIHDDARSAHHRVSKSLEPFLNEPQGEDVDVRLIISRSIDIAASVGARHVKGRATSERIRPPQIFDQYPDDGPLTIHGDSNALQRVLENLLVNAVEHGLAFGRSQVTVSVEVKRLDDPVFSVEILVHDNGPGIHGIYRSRIFEPLFSTKPNGYGMGLAVARQIAEDCGMGLGILHTALLAGTTFYVRLPKQMLPQAGSLTL